MPATPPPRLATPCNGNSVNAPPIAPGAPYQNESRSRRPAKGWPLNTLAQPGGAGSPVPLHADQAEPSNWRAASCPLNASRNCPPAAATMIPSQRADVRPETAGAPTGPAAVIS